MSMNYSSAQTEKTSKLYIVFIAFLSAMVPLSTDMYLPAMPNMVSFLNASPEQVNLTLILYFAIYGLGILIWGPLSDKYGRKPILFTGLSIFTLASLSCGLSVNIFQLIISRMFQALGSGAVTSVVVAIVKDKFSGRQRQSVLAWVQSMTMLAPMLAPILGAFLLKVTSWHGIFYALTGFGAIGLIGSFFIGETIIAKNDISAFKSISRLGIVLKNYAFTLLLLTFSIPFMSMMAFIASSSYIYIDHFGLSEQSYSYYFALNAVFAIIGPSFYMWLSRGKDLKKLLTAGIITIAGAGILIISFGHISPFIFALCVVPQTLMIAFLRTPTTHLMLEQQDQDTGSASSLINAIMTISGSVGMIIVSLGWESMIVAMGTISLTTGLISLGMWTFLLYKQEQKPFVKGI